MRKSIFTLLCTVGLAMAPQAFAEVHLKSNAPEVYEVKKGDSILSVSSRYVSQPEEWKQLWENGNANIHNPHKTLYPGQVIILKKTGGKPSLQLAGGSTQTVVKLSPGVSDVTNGFSIPMLPVAFLRSFMAYPKVLTKKEIAESPEILRSRDDKLIIGTGDRIYVQNLPHEGRYLIFRPDQKLYDPDTGRYLGYSVRIVGDAYTIGPRNGRTVDRSGLTGSDFQNLDKNERWTELHPFVKIPTKVARALQVGTVVDDIRAGDRLMYMPENKFSRFNYDLHTPKTNIRGKIIKIYDGIRMAGNFQTVIINKGEADGLTRGAVLSVYHLYKDKNYSGPRRDDIYYQKMAYPAEKEANVIVYETAPYLSYGLIFGVENTAVAQGDLVSNAGQDLSDFNLPKEHIPNWLLRVYENEDQAKINEDVSSGSKKAF